MRTATITNKFSGKCVTCGNAVAAGAGKAAKASTGWKVYCGTHAPAAPARRVTTPRYSTYRTTEGGYVTYDNDTDDAYDAMRDGFIR